MDTSPGVYSLPLVEKTSLEFRVHEGACHRACYTLTRAKTKAMRTRAEQNLGGNREASLIPNYCI